MSIEMRGAASGRRKQQSSVMTIGKITFSSFDTGRSWLMRMRRSFFVVRTRMIGGKMIGTSAMYEYAATAMEPSRFGESRLARKIAVGP